MAECGPNKNGPDLALMAPIAAPVRHGGTNTAAAGAGLTRADRLSGGDSRVTGADSRRRAVTAREGDLPPAGSVIAMGVGVTRMRP